MSRKTLIITILAIAIIGLAAVTGYFLQRQEAGKVRPGGVATTPEKPVVQPEEPTTTEPIDTSDWKIYRGEKWEWMIRYPPELAGLERTDKEDIHYSSDPKAPEFIYFHLPYQDPGELTPYKFWAGKYLWDKEIGWIPSRDCKPPPIEPDEIRTEKEIDGVHFTRIEKRWEPNPLGLGRLILEIHYLGNYQGICYDFDFFRYLSKNETFSEAMSKLEKELNLFESIVSTFRLLEKQNK
jgi:hypothetical protein